MKQTTVRCPSCGANLDVVEGRNMQFCQYCGTKIVLSDDKAANVDIKIAHDFFGIGSAVKSYIDAKDREKEREHEMDMEEERFQHAHPEIKQKEDRRSTIEIIAYFAFCIIAVALVYFFGKH